MSRNKKDDSDLETDDEDNSSSFEYKKPKKSKKKRKTKRKHTKKRDKRNKSKSEDEDDTSDTEDSNDSKKNDKKYKSDSNEYEEDEDEINMLSPVDSPLGINVPSPSSLPQKKDRISEDEDNKKDTKKDTKKEKEKEREKEREKENERGKDNKSKSKIELSPVNTKTQNNTNTKKIASSNNSNIFNTDNTSNTAKSGIIVEAKKEYTLHLHLLIDDFFCDEFEMLYQHCMKTVKPPENPVNDFLTRLRRIPIASDHYKARILDRFKKAGGDEDVLLGILKALFITHVQLLLAIRTDADKKSFQLCVPPAKDFLFQCMIEIAKGLYDLYASNENAHQKNMSIIKNAIEQAVTKHIPIKQILYSFRDKPGNTGSVMIIPCTPINVPHSQLPSTKDMIRSPIITSNTPIHTLTPKNTNQSVSLKEPKIKEDATVKQLNENGSEKVDTESEDNTSENSESEEKKHLLADDIPTKIEDSIEGEVKTIRTKNKEVSERQGSKELRIRL